MSNVTQNRRRLFRFSLRTLLIAWLLLAAWLAWWITGSQQQQNAIRQIRQLADDPGIYYAHQVLPTSDPGATRIIGDESIASWAPDFLIRWLGIDYFHKVESVIVLNSRPGKDVELATQLAQLSNLRHLALVYAGPTDAAVDQLIKLRQLRSLELSHTSLTDASLKAIGGLSTLEALDITGDFTEAGLAELRRLKHLKLLTINSARLTDAGVAKLGEITTLKRLEIKSPRITDDSFDHLSNLLELEELYLSAARITGRGADKLSNCIRLTSLMFYHTNINDDELQNLAKVTTLESLGLIGSKRVHGKGFQYLTLLSHLRSLNLAASNSTDQAIPFLAQLPALEELDLSFTEVTAIALEELSTASRLRQLTVPKASSTFFSGPISGSVDARQLKRLQQVLPNCNVSH